MNENERFLTFKKTGVPLLVGLLIGNISSVSPLQVNIDNIGDIGIVKL